MPARAAQVPARADSNEADGKDEAIVPTDLNIIIDDDLQLIFKPHPKVNLSPNPFEESALAPHTRVQSCLPLWLEAMAYTRGWARLRQ